MRLRSHPKGFYFLALIAVASMAASCNRKDPNIPKVVKAVEVFDGRFNAAQFHEIYANADPQFQQSVSESQFSEKLTALLQEHGPIQESNVNGFEGTTRWQRLLPELKPTRFIGYYNKCKIGGFQSLFTFDVTADEAKLLQFDTSIEDANKRRQH